MLDMWQHKMAHNIKTLGKDLLKKLPELSLAFYHRHFLVPTYQQMFLEFSHIFYYQ